MARMGTDLRQVGTRVDWVDYAKGFCIVMVVMMHSTAGVEQAAGQSSWMGHVVAFAKPFRMPDFFLISGLFLARVIDRDWRSYLDRKVVHFFYFYVLWVTVQFAFKAPGLATEHGALGVVSLYAEAFIEPFGTLWFIYLLPIFFVVTKLTRKVPPVVIFAIAAALEIAPVETGWTVIDEFAARFVYFYLGYVLAARIFQIAAAAQARPALAAYTLVAWALLNGFYVFSGLAGKPFVSLTLGVAGAAAVVSLAALMAKSEVFAALRYLGRNSIVVYLAFFLGMAASRSLLLKTGLIGDLGTVALLVTACGVAGAVALFWTVRGTRLKFLFERPAWARLRDKPKYALQPAE
ncbi:MAG: hypothetical protein QOF14_2532 [Hyphomicrobiales bacterium]|jgi:uncharacterized membrane protein YcfT|nr:hypothetical protein [Hyphomicrobiales bacterium]